MSISTSLQNLAAALAAMISGLIIVKDGAGHLTHFDIVGYIAMTFTLVAVGASRFLILPPDSSSKKT